jgi:hypothetical protein
MALAAILDLKVRMTPKYYNNYTGALVVPELMGNNT